MGWCERAAEGVDRRSRLGQIPRPRRGFQGCRARQRVERGHADSTALLTADAVAGADEHSHSHKGAVEEPAQRDAAEPTGERHAQGSVRR
jgi:hypothetical protein